MKKYTISIRQRDSYLDLLLNVEIDGNGNIHLEDNAKHNIPNIKFPAIIHEYANVAKSVIALIDEAGNVAKDHKTIKRLSGPMHLSPAWSFSTEPSQKIIDSTNAEFPSVSKMTIVSQQ